MDRDGIRPGTRGLNSFSWPERAMVPAPLTHRESRCGRMRISFLCREFLVVPPCRAGGELADGEETWYEQTRPPRTRPLGTSPQESSRKTSTPLCLLRRDPTS